MGLVERSDVIESIALAYITVIGESNATIHTCTGMEEDAMQFALDVFGEVEMDGEVLDVGPVVVFKG